MVPADVVSHLGNGNSNAGAQQLYDMMDRVRKARTGRESQGTQINPSRYMPGMGRNYEHCRHRHRHDGHGLHWTGQ